MLQIILYRWRNVFLDVGILDADRGGTASFLFPACTIVRSASLSRGCRTGYGGCSRFGLEQ